MNKTKTLMVHRKGAGIIGFVQINFIWRKQYCNKCKSTQFHIWRYFL